jgi:protein O-mannosyl-transferase
VREAVKAKKRGGRKSGERAPAPAPARRLWPWALGLFLAALAVFEAYGPVLRGPFIFDDEYLPFRRPGFPDDLGAWVAGVRPLLMFTYWLNFRISAEDTLYYHVFNVIFHLGASVLAFVLLRRLLALAGGPGERDWLLPAFGAGLFLLHPVQTESVAYVASRSENLSVMLLFGAMAVFLCRRAESVSWGRSAAILALFGAAVVTKEHTVALPAVLLLADYYWNPGFSSQGIRRNWRLYAPMAAAAAAGGAFVWRVLSQAESAGFNVKDFAWYEYFFTQCRALFVYLRLMVLPYGQTLDYDFPISRTPWDHGAILGMAALAGLTVGAWVYRRRYPLASFGWLIFLVLMAPTSSFVPIQDPVAERRLYISAIGLLLIALEFLRRIKADRRMLAGAFAAVLLASAGLTYARNQVWTDVIALWEDNVRKTPRNARAHFHLAFAYYNANRCAEAVTHYEKVAEIDGLKHNLLVDWALAYDCLNRPGDALEKFKQAAALDGTAHIHSQIGMIYAKQARWAEALEALAKAESIDPGYAMTYVYRGGVLLARNGPAAAIPEYRRALALEPKNPVAIQSIIEAEKQLRGR